MAFHAMRVTRRNGAQTSTERCYGGTIRCGSATPYG